jgi:hypothetical protein
MKALRFLIAGLLLPPLFAVLGYTRVNLLRGANLSRFGLGG